MKDGSATIPEEEPIMSLSKPHRVRLGVVGRRLLAAIGVVALLGAGAGIVSAVSTSPQFTVAPSPGAYVPLMRHMKSSRSTSPPRCSRSR